MIICLSSGSRERYRQDIILSLAMPNNYILQFRYDKQWVSPNVLEKFQNGYLIDEKVLIAYVDQSDKDKIPELIPCRLAKITECSDHGSTVSLQFSLNDFAYAKDIDAFNHELHSLSGGTLVNWNDNKKPKGYYCIYIDKQNLTNMVLSKELVNWEYIVNQIAKRSDFSAEKTFYTIESMVDIKDKRKIEPCDGVYKLKPFSEHELNIYHYHPTEGKSKAYLLCNSQAPFVTSLTNPKLLVNSRYDMKHFRFLTAKSVNAIRTVLSIYRGEGENKDEMPTLDFDLNLKIKSGWLKKSIIGILIGLAIASPHIIAALSNNQNNNKTKCLIIIIAIITSLIAGLLASFNLQKGI